MFVFLLDECHKTWIRRLKALVEQRLSLSVKTSVVMSRFRMFDHYLFEALSEPVSIFQRR